jgi:hypothetical protein
MYGRVIDRIRLPMQQLSKEDVEDAFREIGEILVRGR